MSYFVSITRLRIRSPRFLPGFFLHTFRALGQARAAAGYQVGALLADRRRTFWTMTVWDGPDSMRGFMTSGAHRAVMPRLADWCDEASVAHWEQPRAELVAWEEADRRLRAEGRASKVRFPSPGHASFDFPPPRAGMPAPIGRRAG